MKEISFSYERMLTKTLFEKEAKRNSEMAYWFSIFFLLAFNATAEAVMAFVMAMSDLIYDQNPNIWFLDASAAIFIAFILIVYGVR